MKFYYLRAEDIRTINIAYVEARFNEKNEELFLGIVERPQTTFEGAELFPGLFDKAASYLHGFATTQFFSDGNKRTGFLSATVFLNIHGQEWSGPDVDEAETFLLAVAAHQVSIEEVAEWLRAHCVERSAS